MYENGVIIVEAGTQEGYAKCALVPYLAGGQYDPVQYVEARREAFCKLITELTGVTVSNANYALIDEGLNGSLGRFSTKDKIPGIIITFQNQQIGVDTAGNRIYDILVKGLANGYEGRISLTWHECPDFGVQVERLMNTPQLNLAVELAALVQSGRLRCYLT
jgi:hypothetical protein